MSRYGYGHPPFFYGQGLPFRPGIGFNVQQAHIPLDELVAIGTTHVRIDTSSADDATLDDLFDWFSPSFSPDDQDWLIVQTATLDRQLSIIEHLLLKGCTRFEIWNESLTQGALFNSQNGNVNYTVEQYAEHVREVRRAFGQRVVLIGPNDSKNLALLPLMGQACDLDINALHVYGVAGNQVYTYIDNAVATYSKPCIITESGPHQTAGATAPQYLADMVGTLGGTRCISDFQAPNTDTYGFWDWNGSAWVKNSNYTTAMGLLGLS